MLNYKVKIVAVFAGCTKCDRKIIKFQDLFQAFPATFFPFCHFSASPVANSFSLLFLFPSLAFEKKALICPERFINNHNNLNQA